MARGEITITIDPADYGYDVESFDEFDARGLLRLITLAEEAVRALKGAPLSASLRDALDRLASVERRLEKQVTNI